MAKVMRRWVRESILSSTMYVEDIHDIKADNLDDLMIENDLGELIYIEDNYASPHTFEHINVVKNIKGIRTRFRTFPNHPLVQAMSLSDWLKDTDLCASEVRVCHGLILDSNCYEQHLKQLV